MDDTISRAAALDALGERPVVWSDNDDYTLGERNQYDMDRLAIETVPSAQPGCEDAVSRFEVLRLIDYSSHDLNDAVDNRYMQNEIKQLPSVTPKQPGWIPCSECEKRCEKWEHSKI